MGYTPRTRTPRTYSQRRKKAKSKATTQKRLSGGYYLPQENNALTSEELVDRTLNRLRTLGNQRFALPPFNEHFNRWLMNLRDILSEFESGPTMSVDDQFIKERSQILSNVELTLEDRRNEEFSREVAIKHLSDSRIRLEQIEKEHTTRLKEIEGLKDSEIKRLSRQVDFFKEKRDRMARTKMGIFRGILKKVRSQKEAEATQRLISAQSELTSAIQCFNAEQQKCRDEYERQKQNLIEQIRGHQKQVEYQEIDGSLETRRATCETLVSAVNALLQRS